MSAENLLLSHDDQGSGSAVLFVHGHPFNRTMWSPQVQALRWKYRTINPDLRGYGQSGLGTEPSTLEVMSSDLARLLDHLGVERVCIVGLSMGGQIAMEFVRAFPERTSGAVFAATFPQAETTEGVKQRNQMADRLLAEGMVLPGCELLPKLIGHKSLKRIPQLGARVFQMIAATNPAGAAAALRGRALRRDYRESLKAIRVPALIVVGTDDHFTSTQEAELMQASIDGSKLEVFTDVGHMPNLEDQNRFNRLLFGFLDQLVW